MQNPNLAVKQRFQDAVYGEDWDAVADCLHPEFTLEEPNVLVYGGVHRGFSGFQEAWRHIRRTMETLSLAATHTYMTEDPDRMVCELEYQGKVIATGAVVTSTIFERWVFKDGKIINVAPHWLNLPPPA